MEKVESFLKSVQRLQEAIEIYQQQSSNDIIRDGMIYSFKISFEFSWKALKEYLLDQGVANELNFPKQVLKTAYGNQMINDESVWLDMLESRNRTSHIYDDRIAAKIAKDISTRFLPVLEDLAEYFREH